MYPVVHTDMDMTTTSIIMFIPTIVAIYKFKLAILLYTVDIYVSKYGIDIW